MRTLSFGSACLSLLVALGCARDAPSQPQRGSRSAGGASAAASAVGDPGSGATAQASSIGPIIDIEKLPPPASDASLRAALAIADALSPVADGDPARAAFDARSWSSAARGLTARCAASPAPADARLVCIMALVAHWHAGRSADAAAGFDAVALSGDRLSPTLSLWAAEAWLAAGDASKAHASLERIDAKGFARSDRVALIAGRIAAARGNTAAAHASYRLALKMDQHPVADTLFEAAEAAERADAVADQRAWLKDVQIRYPGGKSDERAAVALKRLGGDTALTPAQAVERLERARALHQRDLVLDAGEALLKTLAKGSDLWCEVAVTHTSVLELFWKRRAEAAVNYDEAIAACRSWHDRPKLLYRAAQRHANSASSQRALVVFEMLEKEYPKSTLVDDAMRWRARILREQGHDKEADAVLLAVVAAKGDMVEYAAWDLLWRAVTGKHWREAVKIADKAITAVDHEEKEFNAGRLRYWRARALEMAGKRKDAITGYSDVALRFGSAYYGWLAATRLHKLDAKAATAIESARKDAANATPPQIPAAAFGDPHLLAAVELLRMGMSTSAEAELSAVAWPRGDAGNIVRARCNAAVGRYAKAMVAMAHFDPSALSLVGAGGEAWRLMYPVPKAFIDDVAKAAKASSVDANFIWSIMRTESRFEASVQSPVLATGLLQLMLPTGRAMNARLKVVPKIEYSDLKKPAINIPLGTGYMARLRDRWGGRDALVASSYNAGPGNTRKWLKERGNWPLDAFVEAIPYKENRRYVKSVLTSYLRYSLLSGGKVPKLDLTLPNAGDGEGDD